MGRYKRKKAVAGKDNKSHDSSFMTLRARRSSMRVNLSYVSNLSDDSGLLEKTSAADETSSEEPFVKTSGTVGTVKKCKTKRVSHEESRTSSNETAVVTIDNGNSNSASSSSRTVTEEVEDVSLNVITEKEQQLNRSCMQLKDAIMRKTQAFFDKENELAIKTSEVLTSGYMSPIHNVGELDEDAGQRSPSIRVNIGKNEQVVMSGDGKMKNPVQVSSMLMQNSPTREHNVSSDKTDDDQSIASTPKNSRIDSFLEEDNPSIRKSGTMLKIPVARLFTDDDPNNSMSGNDSFSKEMETESNEPETSATNTNNISKCLNKLNYSTSPILSQGKRRSKLSLSLKKKCPESIRQVGLAQVSSKLSTTTVNESFINNVPLTCSSFIEKPSNAGNANKRNEEIKENKTVNLEDNNDPVNNCKTIDLEDNDKTIEIENSFSSSSCMEITAISAKMPIIQRSMPQIIHKSQTINTHDNTKTSPSLNQKQKSFTSIQIKEPNKEVNILDSVEHNNSNNICQENCNTNTERTSLNVNTSFDRINVADNFVQKENKTPNNLEENALTDENRMEKESDTVVMQCHSTYSVRLSMQVNTSLDSIKKSSNTVNKSLEVSNKLSPRQSTTSVTSTVRSSMQVNTSLDSVRKSPKKPSLDFNKMLSMVQEASTNENQSRQNIYNSEQQSSESELENMSLMERIRNMAATKTARHSKVSSSDTNVDKKCQEMKDQKSSDKAEKCLEIQNKSTETTRKSRENKQSTSKITDESENESNNSSMTRKSNNRLEFNNSKTKSIERQNVSTNSTDSSTVEATPYPISRSVLMKTMIKNNIAMNTIDPRKIINYSDDEDSNTELETINKNKKTKLSQNKYTNIYARKEISSPDSMDTLILDSSGESANTRDKQGEKVVIEESINQTKDCNKSMNKSKKNSVSESEVNDSKKEVMKRKLYPVRENSQLVSFSAAEEAQDSPVEIVPKEITKKKRKLMQKKKQGKKEKKLVKKIPEPDEVSEAEENHIIPEKKVKRNNKPRKIKSKKIVVKKVVNISLINNMINTANEVPPRLSDRNSLGEFDLRNSRSRRKENRSRGPKISIVVTGLSKEDKDLVKSVIKTLGSAVLEVNVTPRTTHVISTGIRTINLLKGILRGCWLVNLEWALKSLESEKWLEPSCFEMTHFSKAVQENRRDRQLFGKAYVPELFVTNGFIYVENGTSPPTSALKELIKIAGGRTTDDPGQAKIIIGSDGLKESWVLDSITTGEVQSIDEYKQN